MATQVKLRVRVCHMPSFIGKCEQIFNEKIVVNALNFSTEAYTGCSALRGGFAKHRDANL
jgi:predicted nucleic acid-binding Zn ribbon protein